MLLWPRGVGQRWRSFLEKLRKQCQVLDYFLCRITNEPGKFFVNFYLCEKICPCNAVWTCIRHTCGPPQALQWPSSRNASSHCNTANNMSNITKGWAVMTPITSMTGHDRVPSSWRNGPSFKDALWRASLQKTGTMFMEWRDTGVILASNSNLMVNGWGIITWQPRNA